MTDHPDIVEYAGWLADKLHNTNDYGKEAAALLMKHAAEITRLRAEAEALRKALKFYADPTRYNGPNQRLEDDDAWSVGAGLKVYRLDVTRDQGVIARAAIAATKEQQA